MSPPLSERQLSRFLLIDTHRGTQLSGRKNQECPPNLKCDNSVDILMPRTHTGNTTMGTVSASGESCDTTVAQPDSDEAEYCVSLQLML